MKSNKFFLILLLIPFLLIAALPALAQSHDANTATQPGSIASLPYGANLGTHPDPAEDLTFFCHATLSFLGIIAILLIFYGGYVGQKTKEVKKKEAKKIFYIGLIALLIIIVAWLLTNFIVISYLKSIT